MMQNTLRTPWAIEPTDRWRGLFNVRDCDGNVIAAAKAEEVARLIATAPATRALLDGFLEDEQRLNRLEVVVK